MGLQGVARTTLKQIVWTTCPCGKLFDLPAAAYRARLRKSSTGVLYCCLACAKKKLGDKFTMDDVLGLRGAESRVYGFEVKDDPRKMNDWSHLQTISENRERRRREKKELEQKVNDA